MQEFLCILRQTIGMLEEMKVEGALSVLQCDSNPLFPFIPQRESRDEARRQFNLLLLRDQESNPSGNRVHSEVTNLVKEMAEMVCDVLEAKYASLLETDRVTVVHDNVPRSNGRAESILAKASWLAESKRKQLAENRETLILASLNKTMAYLAKRPLSWQLKIISQAWKKAPEIAEKQLIVRKEHQDQISASLAEVIISGLV